MLLRLFAPLIAAACSVAWAQPAPWPAKPVRIIVPFGTGGAADLMPRLLGERLAAHWGQPVLVDNRTGAAGNIGMDAGAKATPDGYTLLGAPNGNLVVNPHLYPKLAYDVFRDLMPVVMIAAVQNVLVIHPEVPAKSVRELIALAKAKPGILTYASPGHGSQAHMAGELMNGIAGIDIVHVPYTAVGAALKDVLGGQVSMMFAQMPAALPNVKAGKLRALGVASPARSNLLPDTPTIADDGGFASFDAVSWYALMAPAGTPASIIAKVANDAASALRANDLRERLLSMGAEASGEGPDALAARMRSESDRWREVIRRGNIKVE
ncbi:MAG: Bug family tripartite tricarboxylate transporter substrate binding protein [Burkholderiales bacterium]